MTNSKKTIIFNMRYISLDLTTLNDLDSIESVTSMAIMFCDTGSEETKFLEFNVLQKEYVVKHEQIEKASGEFQKMVKSERVSCYYENLIPYIWLHFSGNGHDDADDLLIVTNNVLERINIIKSVFGSYNFDLFNVPKFSIKESSYSDICNLQREYFEKYHQISK
jgi:hypothetical protein